MHRSTIDDCQWLRETHLRGRELQFKSFTLIGNVDFPEQISLFKSVKPRGDEVPAAVYVRSNFGLMLKPK
jgi:hypothetical protein